MTDFWTPYLCTLTPGCRGQAHSAACQEKNKAYAEANRAAERKRRADHMDAVIQGQTTAECERCGQSRLSAVHIVDCRPDGGDDRG